jgi:RNase P subunit RPR2
MLKNRQENIQKINYLIDFAINENKHKNKVNPYIKDYIIAAFRLAKKINYRLPDIIHYKVCKNCYSLRTPDNTIYRIVNLKKNKKVNKYLKIHCKNCGYVKKINLSKSK